MFEEIKTIVAENLGVEEDSITMESSFKDDLKADSLDLFEMVMALEDVGEHEVMFAGEDEILTISHSAHAASGFLRREQSARRNFLREKRPENTTCKIC